MDTLLFISVLSYTLLSCSHLADLRAENGHFIRWPCCGCVSVQPSAVCLTSQNIKYAYSEESVSVSMLN